MSERPSPPVYTLAAPVGGFGWTVAAREAVGAVGWGGVLRTFEGALHLIDGAHGGDAVAWCGLIEGEGGPHRLAVVLTWSTDAVDEGVVRAVSRALAAGLGVDVKMEGPQAPRDGFFPTLAVLGGQTHRVWLPQEPEPVVVWVGPGPEGRAALFGGPAVPEGEGWPEAPDVVLARRQEEAMAGVDRDEALFLVHAAGRLSRVVDPGLVVRWMQRRLGPVLAQEGLITDDGRIDSEAVREAVEDAVEALKARPEPARRRVVQLLGEPLAGHGQVDEAVARELAMALAALDLLPESAPPAAPPSGGDDADGG